MASSTEAEAALDRILDAAVEEFEEVKEDNEEKQTILEKLDKVIDELRTSPDFEDTIKTTMQTMSGNVAGVQTMDEFLEKQQRRIRAVPKTPEVDVDRITTKTLEHLAKESQGMEGLDTKQVETYGEEMMKNVMGEFEKFGQKEDFSQVVENMMRQLLARDLMYEPLKSVCDGYPEWLAMQKPHLSDDDYLKYGTQYQYFQRIVAVYEREPDNFPRLMELFQDLTTYGQPPAEIIKELAPGLQFTEDGMPITNIDSNVFPTNPGGGADPGLPGIPMPDADAACPMM